MFRLNPFLMCGRFSLWLMLVPFITGCPQGSTTPPDDSGPEFPEITPVDFTAPQSVQARILLPGGSALNPASLFLAANPEDAPVTADGRANVRLISDYPSLVPLVGPDDKVILLGFLSPSGANQEVSVKSTAIALLYFAAGAWNLPPQRMQEMLDRIAESSACALLEAAIASAMQSNPTAIADGDAGIDTALAEARALLFDDAPQGVPTAQAIPQAKADQDIRQQSSAQDLQVFVSPDANTIQGGIQLLQNPAGAGLVAQNNFRRRARIQPYLVATKDAEGVQADITPPREVGPSIEVPTTFSLGLFSSFSQAAQNISNQVSGTGDPVAPWSPVQSSSFTLPREGDATQTIYKIVVLGPTLDVVTRPVIFDDPQFSSWQGVWNAQIGALQAEAFLLDFVLRVLEFTAVGAGASWNTGQQAAALARYRGTMEPFLLSRGYAVPMTTKLEFRRALIEIVKELGSGEPVFRQSTIRLLEEMWGLNNAGKVQIQQLEKNMARAARIGGLITAIDVAMGALDIGAVINDLQKSTSADAWDATVIERRVRINPLDGAVSLNNSGVTFTASVAGLPDEQFVYRWTTTGERGSLFALSGLNGNAIDTTEDSLQYIVNVTLLRPGLLDTVTVEIFPDEGNGTIAPGAISIGSATAVVRGLLCNSLNDLVNIPYAKLRDLIAGVLNVPAGQITCADMEQLTSLSLASVVNFGTDVSGDRLEGLQYAVNLESLDANFSSLNNDDIVVLSELTKLRYLSLNNQGISNLGLLSNLINLQVLDVSKSLVDDLTPLSRLTNLEVLLVSDTKLRDLNGVQSMARLEHIDASRAFIEDISALSGLTNLRRLEFFPHTITDISALASASNLEYLDLSTNRTMNIGSIAALAGKPALRYLDMSNNGTNTRFQDISPLIQSADLRFLDLSNQNIVDLSPIQEARLMTTLRLGGNPIGDINPLRGLTALFELDLAFTEVGSIEVVERMLNLRNLNLRNTNVRSVEPILANLEMISNGVSVSLRCTPAAAEDAANINLILERCPRCTVERGCN